MVGACGRDEPDLENGKAQFVEKCGQCHVLQRAGTAGTDWTGSRHRLPDRLADGIDRDTVEGIVHRQILHPNTESQMPAGLVKGQAARTWPPTSGYAAAARASDEGALAPPGLAQAKTGEQIFTAAGCAGCHTFGPPARTARSGRASTS